MWFGVGKYPRRGCSARLQPLGTRIEASTRARNTLRHQVPPHPSWGTIQTALNDSSVASWGRVEQEKIERQFQCKACARRDVVFALTLGSASMGRWRATPLR